MPCGMSNSETLKAAFPSARNFSRSYFRSVSRIGIISSFPPRKNSPMRRAIRRGWKCDLMKSSSSAEPCAAQQHQAEQHADDIRRPRGDQHPGRTLAAQHSKDEVGHADQQAEDQAGRGILATRLDAERNADEGKREAS